MNPVNGIDMISKLLQWVFYKTIEGVKKFPHWLRTWSPDVVSFVVMVGLFFISRYAIRWLEPTAGVYDAGVLQSVFVSMFKVCCYGTFVWVLIRQGFKELWTWIQKEFKDDFNFLNQWQRVKLFFSFFVALLFLLALLDRGI